MKNSNDTIGNRTRDLPACSAVPQTTAPPNVMYSNGINLKTYVRIINTSEGYNRVLCLWSSVKEQTCAVTLRLHGGEL